MRPTRLSPVPHGRRSPARRVARGVVVGVVASFGLGLGGSARAASPEGALGDRPYYCARVASTPDDWAVYPECAEPESAPSKAEKNRPLVCIGLEPTRDAWLAYPECGGAPKAAALVVQKAPSLAPAYCRGLTGSGDLVAYPECASPTSLEASAGAPRRGAPSFCDGVAPGPENDLAYPECVR